MNLAFRSENHRLGRWPLLDVLRTLALLNMLAFYVLLDLQLVRGLAADGEWLRWAKLWQQLICSAFIVLSGMCFAMGRDHLRRGLELNLLGLAVTAFTWLFTPEHAVYYGVLTFLGMAMWLSHYVKRYLLELPAMTAMVMCYVSYSLFRNLDSGVMRCSGKIVLHWPQWLYTDWLALLGFHSPGFASADYVPLLPNIFLFWFGVYAFRLLHAERREYLSRYNFAVLTQPGKLSLTLYLLHPPVLLGLSLLK